MRKPFLLRLFLALTLLLPLIPGQAQEFNCKVQVIAPQIQSTPKRIWQSMETAIVQLMNTRPFPSASGRAWKRPSFSS